MLLFNSNLSKEITLSNLLILSIYPKLVLSYSKSKRAISKLTFTPRCDILKNTNIAEQVSLYHLNSTKQLLLRLLN